MTRLHKSLAATLLAVSLFSCKEQLPIGLDLSIPQGDDSVYVVSPAPAAQPKHVLMEEFTGTTCANCPKGSAEVKNLMSQHGDKLIVAKMYSYFLCEKVAASDPELKSDQAQEIAVFFDDPNKPTALIDRQYNTATSVYYQQAASWASLVTQQLAKSSPINIDVHSAYNSTDKKVDLEINFVMNQAVSGSLNYSIYVVEDGIIAGQDSMGIKLYNYEHNEVMQQCVTPTSIGSSLPMKFKTDVAGNALRKKLSFILSERVINPDKCKVIVFVHRNDSVNKNKEVLQVAEVHLQ